MKRKGKGRGKKDRVRSLRYYHKNRNEINGRRYFDFAKKEIESLHRRGLLHLKPGGFRLTQKGYSLFKSLQQFASKQQGGRN